MRKVILQIDVTLDGFIAGLKGEMNWITANESMNSEASDLLDTVDTILLGRVAYQDFVTFWPFADMTSPTTVGKITSQINHADKIIFSKTLDKVEWGRFNNARLIRDDIPEAMNNLKAQAGKDILLYAGSSIISTFVQANLIDEYRLRINPVVIGSGLPLFQNVENWLKLNLIRTRSYDNGVVMLVYQPK